MEGGEGSSSIGEIGRPPMFSRLKKDGLSVAISFQEGWQYIKAIFTGQVNKAKARNEKEASEADMQIAKTQVEAADEAESRKKQLEM